MLFEIYGTILNSDIDLSPLGLRKLEETKTLNPDAINLEFFLAKNMFLERDMLDNQTMVNNQYGYYYKKNLCIYEFFDGSTIRITYQNQLTKEILYPLLNYPLAAIFYQRKNLVMHASAIRYKNKTFLFPGTTMSGKSSIAAYMIDIGAKLITEDICIISFVNKDPYAISSYPTIKISDELKENFTTSKEKDDIFFQEKNNRRVYQLNNTQFLNKKSKIDFIIFPEWSRSKNYDFFEIKKSVSLKKILQSSFFSYADFNQEDFFKMNVCLTEGVRCFQFKRYKDFFSFKYLDEFISKI